MRKWQSPLKYLQDAKIRTSALSQKRSLIIYILPIILQSSTELLTQEDHETFLVERSRRPRSVVPAMDHNEQQQHTVQHSSGPPSDVVIVPRRGPRPPSRKRPKSTPIINISHMMAEKKR